MQRGLDWYKREPISFLGGVQGLTAKQIAVYTIILDLIYQHGGEINNDPSWVAGWIKDCGSAVVRNTITDLVSMEKLIINGDKITQKRAQNESKTRTKLSQNRSEIGKKGGVSSAKKRATSNKTNDLVEPIGSSETQAEEKRREESPPPPSASPPQIEQEAKPETKKGTRLTKDWQPSQADVDLALHEGLNHDQINRTADTFRDYWTAKTGAQATKLDWSATWRNWIRRDTDRKRNDRGQRATAHENLTQGFARSAAKDEDAARTGRDTDAIPF